MELFIGHLDCFLTVKEKSVNHLKWARGIFFFLGRNSVSRRGYWSDIICMHLPPTLLNTDYLNLYEFFFLTPIPLKLLLNGYRELVSSWVCSEKVAEMSWEGETPSHDFREKSHENGSPRECSLRLPESWFSGFLMFCTSECGCFWMLGQRFRQMFLIFHCGSWLIVLLF